MDVFLVFHKEDRNFQLLGSGNKAASSFLVDVTVRAGRVTGAAIDGADDHDFLLFGSAKLAGLGFVPSRACAGGEIWDVRKFGKNNVSTRFWNFLKKRKLKGD